MKTSSRNTSQAAVALLIIVIMYILCNLPRLALNLSEYLLQAELYAADTCGCFLSPVWFSVMCSLNHFLLTFNSSTNFLIYWSVGGSPKKCCQNIVQKIRALTCTQSIQL